ncbi:hypothetical protein GCM10027589_52000 [Actinocorallia lasiicapitis]
MRTLKTAVVSGAALSLALLGVGLPAAQATAQTAGRGGDSVVTGNKSGKLTVTKVSRTKVSGRNHPGVKGTGKRSSSKGVDYKRKPPKNLKMLDASSPAKLARNIIGADNRYQINPTNWWPASATGLVTFTMPNGQTAGCTAFLYAHNAIATAGKCVYMHDATYGHGWNTNWVFYPARNGSTSPFGSCGYKHYRTSTSWVNNADEHYNWGGVELNCNVGVTAGYLGLRTTTASLTGTWTTLAGYPNDKPWGTLWAAQGSISSTSTYNLFYGIDTSGQTGAALRDNDTWAIGIHTVGTTSYNQGVRITQSIYNSLTNLATL